MLLYNIGIWLYGLAIRLAAPFNAKAREWVRGRKGWREKVGGLFRNGDRVIWIHCASLGEFEQGRPVMERIRGEHPEYKILLTFFSPSGYRIRKDYEHADAVVYLPLDTPRNVRRFLDALRPEMAVFVKYEFWLNYLSELGRRGIGTYIISAIFRPDSVFFRPYGGMFRRALGTFSTIFVQNRESKELLEGIGITNAVLSGDTRFDRVAEIPDTAGDVPVARRFTAGGGDVLVAGSTWPHDEELLASLLSDRAGLKVIMAPHEIEPERIERLISAFPESAVRYTACDGQTDMARYRILIIDTIGLLSSVYRYGKYAYVGGGFGAGIHNTLEAATYGLPVAFGPNYSKFREAKELIALGAAVSVSTVDELVGWYDSLTEAPRLYADAKAKALSYIAANKGASDTIMSVIFGSKPSRTAPK
ncbi:MAG: 3-deoxy-D-manno-octulosonic acid transferase [Rikenellaceae bacterium]|nr:3-deoxy-D-manno-octulosonic acid transferase [Rikenellaceae bacterium]